MIHLGGGARDGGCVAIVALEYSALDQLDGGEAYPGPVSKSGDGFRERRRLWWHSGHLVLSSKAPVTGAHVNRLWEEIAEMGARRMFAEPTATMLEALLPRD